MPIQFNGTGTISGVTSTIAQGGTDVSSAVDVTLTNASTQIQNITMTAAGRFVVLPNATTLGEGANTFIINNRGTTAFGVKNAAGEIILALAPSQNQSVFSLLDNSTSAGKWASGTVSLNVYLNNPNITATAISSAVFVTACALSASSVVLSYRTNTAPAGVYVVAGTVSGGVITFGTPVQVSNTSGTAIYAMVAYSSTQFVFSYYDNNSGQSTIRAGTVSGTTITLGAAPTSSLGSGFTGVAMISPTVGVWGYNPNSGSQIAFRAFTLSGTTFTFGTAITVSLTTLSENPYPSSMMQVTSGVLAYDVKVCAGSNAKGFISNSGTTLTLGNTYSRVTSPDYFYYSPSPNTIVGQSGVYTLTGSNTISAYTTTSNLALNNIPSYWSYNIPKFSEGVSLLPYAGVNNAYIVYANNGTSSGFQTVSISGLTGASATAVLDSTTGIIAGYSDTALLQAYIVKFYWT
jgi:hypothetical protein